MKKFISNDGTCVEITVRQIGKTHTAWAEHRKGSYKGTKVLPNSNTAIVQNFGYEAKYFDYIP